MDDATLKLWVIVGEEEEPFPVTILLTPEVDGYDLKEVILTRMPQFFAEVNVPLMKLWAVRAACWQSFIVAEFGTSSRSPLTSNRTRPFSNEFSEVLPKSMRIYSTALRNFRNSGRNSRPRLDPTSGLIFVNL